MSPPPRGRCRSAVTRPSRERVEGEGASVRPPPASPLPRISGDRAGPRPPPAQSRALDRRRAAPAAIGVPSSTSANPRPGGGQHFRSQPSQRSQTGSCGRRQAAPAGKRRAVPPAVGSALGVGDLALPPQRQMGPGADQFVLRLAPPALPASSRDPFRRLDSARLQPLSPKRAPTTPSPPLSTGRKLAGSLAPAPPAQGPLRSAPVGRQPGPAGSTQPSSSTGSGAPPDAAPG